MEQRVSLITLGVADVGRARTFYERLGWQGQEVEETVFFQAGGMALVLWAETSSRMTQVSMRGRPAAPAVSHWRTTSGREPRLTRCWLRWPRPAPR